MRKKQDGFSAKCSGRFPARSGWPRPGGAQKRSFKNRATWVEGGRLEGYGKYQTMAIPARRRIKVEAKGGGPRPQDRVISEDDETKARPRPCARPRS